MNITQTEADTLDDWYCRKCSGTQQTSPGAGQKRKRTEPSSESVLSAAATESRTACAEAEREVSAPVLPPRATLPPPSAVGQVRDHVPSIGSVNGATRVPLPTLPRLSPHSASPMQNGAALPPLSHVPFASHVPYVPPVQYADKYLQSHAPVVYSQLPPVPYYTYPPQYSAYNGL